MVVTISSSTEQLAPLASQHHTSEYNRLKFGPKGCPVKYLPLSVQLPDIFQELRRRQEQSSLAKPWWLSSYKPPSHSPLTLDSRHILPENVLAQLAEDINAALSTSLDLFVTPPVQQLNPTIKTSSSHPINVSSVIPPELLPFISSHVTPARALYPTMFTVPPAFTLNRLTPYSPPAQAASQQPSPKYELSQTVTDALKAAITDTFSFSAWNIGSGQMNFILPTPTRSHSLQSSPPNPSFPASYMPISLSLSLPNLGTVNDTLPSDDRSFTGDELLGDPLHLEDNPLESSLLLSPSPGQKLGNLFLSSCPGKKVRLDGPVRGRGGVYRDLETDLRRIRQLGVRCLICCLDDLELNFLGAPWPQYEQLAQKTGLDVLRIPTPEGLAPLEPSSVDSYLTRVIENYTLSGAHVLVHCRGGVGRAGVIACCWLIRLGICGWIEQSKNDNSASHNMETRRLHSQTFARPGVQTLRNMALPVDHNGHDVPIDTIDFVERVIAFVRRRRSMKAIETYEQVRFLVDFVEYLRSISEHSSRL